MWGIIKSIPAKIWLILTAIGAYFIWKGKVQKEAISDATHKSNKVILENVKDIKQLHNDIDSLDDAGVRAEAEQYREK